MDDADARRLLRRGAGRLPFEVPIDAIERRGRRLRWARRLRRGALGTAMCVVVALVAAVVISGPRTQAPVAVDDEPGGDPGQSGSAAVTEQRTDDPAGVKEPCALPGTRPTYLPWMKADDGIGRPQIWRGGPEDGDSAQLTWFRDRNAPPEETVYVALRRVTELAGTGGGRSVDVRLGGVEGRIGRGTQPGDAWIGWDDGARTCNLVELELTTSGSYSAARAQREIVRVARSLVPDGPDANARSSEPTTE